MLLRKGRAGNREGGWKVPACCVLAAVLCVVLSLLERERFFLLGKQVRRLERERIFAAAG